MITTIFERPAPQSLSISKSSNSFLLDSSSTSAFDSDAHIFSSITGINSELRRLWNTPINAIGEVSRRDDESVKANTIPKVTEDLALALVDILESESLERIPEDNSSLDIPHSRSAHQPLETRLEREPLTSTSPSFRFVSAPCTCCAPCE